MLGKEGVKTVKSFCLYIYLQILCRIRVVSVSLLQLGFYVMFSNTELVNPVISLSMQASFCCRLRRCSLDQGEAHGGAEAGYLSKAGVGTLFLPRAIWIFVTFLGQTRLSTQNISCYI